MEQSGGLIVPSYIRRVLGKAAGIASALTLGFLSYTATPAKAAEAPKKFEDPDLVRIVADSYKTAPKGKETDEAIMRLMLSACQDPAVSPGDVAYIITSLGKKISDPKKKQEFTVLGVQYQDVKKQEAAAMLVYQKAFAKATAIRDGKARAKAIIPAAKAYYAALKKLEAAIPETQYAQRILEVAREGLARAQEVPETCDVPIFEEYVAEAKKTAEQAEKEEHLLSQIIEYDSLIETALTNAEKERTAAGKINWYTQIIDALKQAEEIFPHTQFASQITELEAIINGLQQAKPPESTVESGKEKDPAPAGETQPQPGKKDDPQPAPGKKDDPQPQPTSGSGDVSSGKKDAPGVKLTDVLAFARDLGSRYDSMLDFRHGIIFEDFEGDRESMYLLLGDTVELALLREYLHKRNVAGNLVSDENLSGFLETSPLAMIFNLDPRVLKVGGTIERLGNKEWVYNEETLSDTATETETKTANIRNFINREFMSFWADTHIPNLVKARIAAMLDRTDFRTEENSLTWHENHTDPSASYGVEGQDETSDMMSKQVISALLGIPFEFVTEGKVKGFFGASLDSVLQTYSFAGAPRKTTEILKPGLRAELYVDDDFGIAAAFLQDINKEEGEDTRKAKTYRGQIAAALNLGTVTDEQNNPLFKAFIFGNAWVTGYEGDVFHGAGGGLMLGSDVVRDISGLVQLLFDRDSRKTGSRPELGDELGNEDTMMRSFLERKGFNNIPVGIIGGKNKYGFALMVYGGAGKAIGERGRTVTEKFGELSAVLDTPALALIISGYYADMALERQWGMRFRADVKRGLFRGFAGAIEFNQSNYLLTDELEKEIALAFEVPLGADKDDKDGK